MRAGVVSRGVGVPPGATPTELPLSGVGTANTVGVPTCARRDVSMVQPYSSAAPSRRPVSPNLKTYLFMACLPLQYAHIDTWAAVKTIRTANALPPPHHWRQLLSTLYSAHAVLP